VRWFAVHAAVVLFHQAEREHNWHFESGARRYLSDRAQPPDFSERVTQAPTSFSFRACAIAVT
jgi:hypothetical protein